MKKIIAWLMSCTVIAGISTGCGKIDAESSTGTSENSVEATTASESEAPTEETTEKEETTESTEGKTEKATEEKTAPTTTKASSPADEKGPSESPSETENNSIVGKWDIIDWERTQMFCTYWFEPDGKLYYGVDMTSAMYITSDWKFMSRVYKDWNDTEMEEVCVIDYDGETIIIDDEDDSFSWKRLYPETKNPSSIDGIYIWEDYIDGDIEALYDDFDDVRIEIMGEKLYMYSPFGGYTLKDGKLTTDIQTGGGNKIERTLSCEMNGTHMTLTDEEAVIELVKR